MSLTISGDFWYALGYYHGIGAIGLEQHWSWYRDGWDDGQGDRQTIWKAEGVQSLIIAMEEAKQRAKDQAKSEGFKWVV